MKVLMISGDANMMREGTAAHQRYLLQAAQVEELSVLCRHSGESKFSAVLRMVKEGKKNKWDVVTAQDPFWLGHIAWHISKKIGASLQIQVHTDLSAQPLWKRMFANVQLRRASSIRVVSERIKKELESLNLSAPITVLPVFIDLEAVRAAPAADIQKQFPHFEKIVFVASRLEPEKDVALAIKSFAVVLKTLPKAGLLIAGEGSQRQELEKLTEKLNLSAQIIFLGYRPDVFSFYKSAGVVLNTSRYEGFGASLVEALAAGCAVVSTDVGVAREAGAIVSSKKEISAKVIEVLTHGTRGELKLILPPALAWAQSWCDTLTV